jgi:hypothetical protein
MAVSKKEIDRRVADLVNKGYTAEEAELLVKEDMMIDAGETCDWETELTDEQAKVSRQARQASREVSDTPAKRKRAEDPDKRALIEAIEESIGDLVNYTEDAPNLIITNPEREIEFTYHGRKFKITLSAPRPPKN